MPNTKKADLKMELLRTAFRNMYLKEKFEYLDSECKMLAEKILSCQVVKAEKGEMNINLERELENLKQLEEHQLHSLTLAEEEVNRLLFNIKDTTCSALDSLNEKKSIAEELNVKNDMIKCLQEELVNVRLEAAEKYALIRELTLIKSEFENDKNVLLKSKPETVFRLQEDLMEAKIREQQFSLDFERIKKQLRQMRERLKNENYEQKETTKEGNVEISKKGVLWNSKSKTLDKIAVFVRSIEKLDVEKAELEKRIPDLQNKIEVIHKHVEFKETEKRKLQEKLDGFKIKHQSTENIILERRRQYNLLESSAQGAVTKIRKSVNRKNEDIDELSCKLAEVSERKQSYSSTVRKKEANLIQDLEHKICVLQNKIKQLEVETSQ